MANPKADNEWDEAFLACTRGSGGMLIGPDGVGGPPDAASLVRGIESLLAQRSQDALRAWLLMLEGEEVDVQRALIPFAPQVLSVMGGGPSHIADVMARLTELALSGDLQVRDTATRVARQIQNPRRTQK